MQKKVYSSQSSLRTPALFFKSMWSNLLSSRELTWRLFIRDIKAQYRQTFLGLFWIFLPPVAMAIGLSIASKAKVINLGTTDIPYIAYVIIGMSLWQTFVESLEGPSQSFKSAKTMLAKVNFPYEALVLAKIAQVLFNFSVKLILIVFIFIWYQIQLSPMLLLALPAFLVMIMFATFLGLLMTPLASLYEDFTRALTIITSFWFFMTPVVYPTPTSGGLFSQLVQLNPVTPLLQTTRELMTLGYVTDLSGFLMISIFSLFGLLLSWVFYRLAMPFVIERMSA